MNKIIVTHPDNVEALRRILNKEQPPPVQGEFSFSMFNDFGVEIRTDSRMDRTKPTGKFIQGGEVVEKEDIYYKEPFIEYGPEDAELLVYLGYIKEEQELMFYQMDLGMMRMEMDFMPFISDRRVLINHSGV